MKISFDDELCMFDWWERERDKHECSSQFKTGLDRIYLFRSYTVARALPILAIGWELNKRNGEVSDITPNTQNKTVVKNAKTAFALCERLYIS